MATKTRKTRRRNKKLNSRKRSPKREKVMAAAQGPSVVLQEQEEADRQADMTGPDQCLPPDDSDTESGLRKEEIDDEASVG